MSAMEAIQSTLIYDAPDLVTNKTGGTSKGDSSAGTGSSSTDSSGETEADKVTTTADKAGAGIVTTLMIICVIGGVVWMIME